MTTFALVCWLAVPGLAPRQDPAAPPPSPAVLEPAPAALSPAARARALARLEAENQELRHQVRDELLDTVANQEVAVQAARLDLAKAKLVRDTRQYEVKEYVEGIFNQDYETARGEISLAQDDFRRANDQVQAIEPARRQGVKISSYQETSLNLTLEKARFELEQAQTQMDILLKFTKDQTTKKLEGLVAAAEADVMAKQLALDSQSKKLERRRQQSSRLQARVPEDFVVALLDEVMRQEGKIGELVGEMATLSGQVAADPDHADRVLAQIAQKRAAVRALAEEIKQSLLDATEVADEVRQTRQRYLDAEKQLVRERAIAKDLAR